MPEITAEQAPLRENARPPLDNLRRKCYYFHTVAPVTHFQDDTVPDIIHVDMDCFFAAVEVKDNPDLAGKPVIVGALPGTRGVVAACNYEAREFGIHSAMPISRAFKLCPDGVFLKPNGRRYGEESAHIQAIFRRFTPLVEPISVDEAFLDVTGSHRMFGTSEEIGREIKRLISEETGLTASVGIAPTKFVAKIASDHNKPDGFVIVREDEVLAFLAPLDVGDLWGVGKQTEKRLAALGISTIGDLRAFPAADIERRFGTHGRHLHALAHGIDDRSVVTDTDRKQVSNEHTFPEDEGDRAEVERTLLALADKVAGRLLKKELKGRRLTLKLRDEAFRTITRSHTLETPISTSEDIYHEALVLFRRETLDGLKVRLIGIGVSGFDEDAQLSLFTESSGKKTAIDSVMASIRDRFGDTAIDRASLADNPPVRRRH
jgi:DNA polymerase IV